MDACLRSYELQTMPSEIQIFEAICVGKGPAVCARVEQRKPG